MSIEYSWVPGTLAQDELVQDCVTLFSEHYGVWSQADPQKRAGQNIRFSISKLRNLISSADSRIVFARDATILVGYAIALQTKIKDWGMVSWVTQLVVHKDYRKQDVGKTLLFTIWGFSDHFAWGLISANPYAIRALEKATRRRCEPSRIARNYRKLMNVGAEHVPYISEQTKVIVNEQESRVFTDFYVDHSELQEMIKRVSDDKEWAIGQLQDGWEWFAFTFHDQAQLDLSARELETMLEASDQITKKAYAGMTLDTSTHKWMRHTEYEVAFILKHCEIDQTKTLLDIGCGRGRHIFELSKYCKTVVGIDYVDKFVSFAQGEASSKGIKNASFVCGDSRNIRSRESYDAVICLYDVIGTFADDEANERLMQSISHHLRPGGKALISVINMALTIKSAKNLFVLSKEPNRLLDLQPSNVMQSTGDIFDPALFLVDTERSVVYRREQFSGSKSLPVELLVRDRRYYITEIMKMCERFGLQCKWARHVSAGKWENDLGAEHSRAKEILILCEKA